MSLPSSELREKQAMTRVFCILRKLVKAFFLGMFFEEEKDTL
jgi:hypothetical protein